MPTLVIKCYRTAHIFPCQSPGFNVALDGERVKTASDFIFLGSKSLQMVTAAMKLKDTYSWEGKL